MRAVSEFLGTFSPRFLVLLGIPNFGFGSLTVRLPYINDPRRRWRERAGGAVSAFLQLHSSEVSSASTQPYHQHSQRY